jgi:hypothetical protein
MFNEYREPVRAFPGTLMVLALCACQTANIAPPEATDTMAAVLRQTAAIVEGTVAAIAPRFDNTLGPRHRVRLAGVIAHLGSVKGGDLNLDMYGGPLPNGRYARITEQARFVNGGHYIVFLRNTSWFFSPETTDILRVETIVGREVLVNDKGFPVIGVDDQGLRFGNLRLFDVRYDYARPFEGPRANPNVTAQELDNVLDRGAFISAVRDVSARIGLVPSGEFISRPTANHPWNRIPTSPARR